MAQGAKLVAAATRTDSKADRATLKLPYEFVSPVSRFEAQMCGVFSDVMRIEPVGATDDFYDLGGDSLMGEEISMEILRITGKAFPISALFDAGNPRAIAAFLGGGGLSLANDSRSIIFVVHGRGGFSLPSQAFMSGISAATRLVMFEFPGIRGDKPHPKSVRETAGAYVDQIMEMQPEGPVRLASFCAGGLIALAMAEELEKRGRPLDRLVLIDPSVPRRLVNRGKAEERLAAQPDSFGAKANYVLRTGRLPGGHAFVSPLVNRIDLRVRTMFARLTVKSLNNTKGDRFRGQGLKDGPRASLIASYRHADLKPFKGKAFILASSERAHLFEARDSWWEKIVPDREVIVMAASHQDVLNGASAEVSAAMERQLAS